MKHSNFSFSLSFTLFLLIILSPLDLSAQQMFGDRFIKKGMWKSRQVEYVDRQIALKIGPGVQMQDVSALLNRHKGLLVKVFDELRWGLVELPDGSDIFPVIDSLKNHPLIEAAEPNGIMRTSFDPNDSCYQQGLQWGLKNYGQNPPGGQSGADIHASQAWNITQGSSNVIIAILDSGIPILNGSLSHPDLDDPNKIILGEDEVGDGEGVRDLWGHGTHVAGIAAAETNNSTGIAGVAGACKILVVQVFDSLGRGTTSQFESGVVSAVAGGQKSSISAEVGAPQMAQCIVQ